MDEIARAPLYSAWHGDRYKYLPVDDLYWISRYSKSLYTGALTGGDVETETMRATGHDIAPQLSGSERGAGVRAGIARRIYISIYFEEGDVFTRDAYGHRPAGPKPVERDSLVEFVHLD